MCGKERRAEVTALSVQRDRVARGAGGALDLERRPNEEKLVGLVGDQLAEVQVLEVPDAALGLQLDVAFERLLRFAAEACADGVGAPGVRAGQRDLARGEVLAGRNPEAGLPGV